VWKSNRRQDGKKRIDRSRSEKWGFNTMTRKKGDAVARRKKSGMPAYWVKKGTDRGEPGSRTPQTQLI